MFFKTKALVTIVPILLVVFLFASGNCALAEVWSGPTGLPPNGNVAKPLNVDTIFGGQIGGTWNSLNLTVTDCTSTEVLTKNLGLVKCVDLSKFPNSQVVPTLLSVLNTDPDASAFSNGIKIGASTGAWMDLGGAFKASWLHASNPIGTSTFAGGMTIAKNLSISGQIMITGGNPGVNKVLTSNASGLATWQNLPTPTPFVTSSLLEVLNKNSNASSFTATTLLGGGLSVKGLTATGLVVNGGATITGNVGIGTATTTSRLSVVAPKAGIYSEVNSGTFTGNIEANPQLWNRAGYFKVNGTYGAEAWLATTPYHVNGSYGVYANGVSAGVFGYGQNIGVLGKGTPGSVGVKGYIERCDQMANADDCSMGSAVYALTSGYGTAVKAEFEYPIAGDTTSIAVNAYGPNAVVATAIDGWSGYFSGGKGVHISNALQLGVNKSKGTCTSANAGAIVYEEINNVGSFKACAKTGVGTYAWKNIFIN